MRYLYQLAKSVGLDNQWVGIGMIIVALAFYSYLWGTLSGWVLEAII